MKWERGEAQAALGAGTPRTCLTTIQVLSSCPGTFESNMRVALLEPRTVRVLCSSVGMRVVSRNNKILAVLGLSSATRVFDSNVSGPLGQKL